MQVNGRAVAVVISVFLALVSPAARCLAAQSSSATTATVTVHLRDLVRGIDVSGVLVEMEGERGGMVRSDARGRARFVDRPLGVYVIRVNARGYVSVEERAELVVAGAIELPVDLTQVPDGVQPLPAVISTARRSPIAGLDDRRATARGHIFDRETIDSLAPRVTSDLLRRVPSVRLIASGGGFVPRTRRSSGISDCPMSIYLDGVQVDDERGAPPAPPMGAPARSARAAPPSLIDGIAVELLEAMEVYVGASEIPTQFNQAGGSCGVVVLWTRTRR
jgi:hypothetical protein